MSTAHMFLKSRYKKLRTISFRSTDSLIPVKLLKAPMANSVRSEHQSPPMRLIASVLLLGTLLAWGGTRDRRRPFGELPRKEAAAAPRSAPANVQIDSAIVARGYQIDQRRCAGCHEMSTRSTGPSYKKNFMFFFFLSVGGRGKKKIIYIIV